MGPPLERREVVPALLVAMIVLVSRLPFLAPGYGTDPDAWRIAWAAHGIASTGRYEAARFPGNPIQEIVSAVAIGGGPLALCGLAALFSAFAAASFTLALRRLASRDAVLGGLALAATPAVFLASVQAMDYVWALAFALAALVAALSGRPVATGILAGLAIGCRISSVGWLAPLALALWQARPAQSRVRDVAIGCAVALAVGAAAFAPVFLTYGPGFFRFYQTGYPAPAILIKQTTVDLWGIPGSIAIGLAFVAGLLGLRRGARQRSSPTFEPSIPGRPSRWLITAWTSGALIFVAAYLRLPIKAYYLLPLVAFALLLVAQLAARRVFVAVCVALVVSPWVLKLSQAGRLDAPAPTIGTVPLRLLGQPLVLDLLRGPILTDHARRIERTRYVDRVLARARALPGENVIVCWDWLPEIRVRIGGKQDGSVTYAYLMPADELAALRERGTGVHYLAGADGEVEHIHGYDPRAAGMSALEVGGPVAPGGSPAP